MSEKLTEAAILHVRNEQLKINRLLLDGRIKSPVHLALGHESVAVAVSAAMGAADKLFLPHRNLHYAIARGVTVEELLESYNGPLGSMNAVFPSHGIAYTSSILAGHLPVAVGAACMMKAKGEGVAWAVIGDGATESGTFYESLIMARRLSVPIVFVVEDNNFSMASNKHERRGFNLIVPWLCYALDIRAVETPEEARAEAAMNRPALVEFTITSDCPHHGAVREAVKENG